MSIVGVGVKMKYDNRNRAWPRGQFLYNTNEHVFISQLRL